MTLLRVFAAILFAGAMRAGTSGPIAGPPPLEDQNGKQDSLDAHHGRAVIVLAVSGERSGELKGWEAELRARFDGLDFLRVVNIPQHPGVRPEEVMPSLRGKLPKDVSVLIDTDGVWASMYDLDTSEMNVALFDHDGRLVARFRGKRAPALVERVSQEIEAKLGVARKPDAGPATK